MFDFIPPSLYWPLYDSFLAILIVSVAIHTFCYPNHLVRKQSHLKLLALFFIVFACILMGFRPPVGGIGFGDTSNYHYYFLKVQNTGVQIKGDWFFYYIMLIFSKISSDGNSSPFFFAIFVCYVGIMSWALYRWFARDWLLPFAFMVFSAFFISYGVNGIRNGLATSFFLIGLSYYSKQRWVWLTLAFLTHSSMLLPISAVLLFSFFKHINWYVYGWLFCLILSISVPSIGNMISDIGLLDDKLSLYFDLDTNDAGMGISGFRVDFIFYSLLPIVVGLYYVYKLKFLDKLYLEILSIYITVNAFWLLVIRIPFSNRIVYLSWFMYGLVLVYPFIKSNPVRYQNRYVSVILLLLFIFNQVLF